MKLEFETRLKNDSWAEASTTQCSSGSSSGSYKEVQLKRLIHCFIWTALIVIWYPANSRKTKNKQKTTTLKKQKNKKQQYGRLVLKTTSFKKQTVPINWFICGLKHFDASNVTSHAGSVSFLDNDVLASHGYKLGSLSDVFHWTVAILDLNQLAQSLR